MLLHGFIDSHMHFLGLGYVSSNIDLNNAKSIDQIKEILKKHTHKKILLGRGWNQANLIEKRTPTKDDLNSISRDIPIILTRVCGHVLIANDKAMELAGLNEFSRQVDGGFFDFNTGLFSENALGLIINTIPKPSSKDLEEYLIAADEILLKNGVTSVASDDFCIFHIPFEEIIDVIKKMYEEDKIHVRITEQVNLPYDQLKEFIQKGYANKELGKLKMGPLKILADGSLGGKTAYLNQPYEDDKSNYGIQTYSDEELFKLVHLANSNDMDVVIHAIGDASIDQALRVLIKSIQETKRYHHNHAIIHAQLATKTQIKDMKKYNIGAIIQPIFLNSDIPIIESRIGKRSKESYLFKTMYSEGVHVGFSTDSPVEPISPFLNLYSAITRKSIKHQELKPFLIQESYKLSEALLCYTENNLRYIYQDHLPKGDYIIIDKEIDSKSIEELLTTEVSETYIDNFLVYKK